MDLFRLCELRILVSSLVDVTFWFENTGSPLLPLWVEIPLILVCFVLSKKRFLLRMFRTAACLEGGNYLFAWYLPAYCESIISLSKARWSYVTGLSIKSGDLVGTLKSGEAHLIC